MYFGSRARFGRRDSYSLALQIIVGTCLLTEKVSQWIGKFRSLTVSLSYQEHPQTVKSTFESQIKIA